MKPLIEDILALNFRLKVNSIASFAVVIALKHLL